MLNVYSVYDTVAETYSNPVFTEYHPEHLLAIRAIKAQMFDAHSMLAMFPDNYELHYLCKFDECEGEFVYDDESNTVIMSCDDALRELREERSEDVQK